MESVLANLINHLWPATKPPDMAGSQQSMSEDLQKILRLQEKEKELRRSFQTNEEKFSTLQMQMEDMRSNESDNLVKDPKSALRLPVCHPPIFSGKTVDFIPSKRNWKATMGVSYPEEVQLVQMKLSIPERLTVLIGLSDIRSMADFYKYMDDEHFDPYALCQEAISDIKNLDRTVSRFIQMMKVKLSNHSKNLDIYGM
jgi:hypothetical protein